VIPIVTRITINPRQRDNCVCDANTRRQRREPANSKKYNDPYIRIFCIIERPVFLCLRRYGW